MSTLDLVNYYVGLLIQQYTSKPKATGTVRTQVTPVLMPQATVQTLTFDPVPTEGEWILVYDEEVSDPLVYNASDADVNSALTFMLGNLGLDPPTSVTGNMTDGFTITYDPSIGVALSLSLDPSSTISGGSTASVMTCTEVDETLPLAVQNGFNLLGDDLAVGDQLDMLGKYAGVSRTGHGFTTQITLDDTDFISLIRMAIVRNNAGSSLYTIQSMLAQFFPDGQLLVFDYKNMRMSYLVSETVGSQELVQLFITENLLPKPMGVQLALVIYAPVITTFFGFRTYTQAAFNASPFNSYSDYQTDMPWLSYADAVYY